MSEEQTGEEKWRSICSESTYCTRIFNFNVHVTEH